jgi:hypothetical protein
LRKSEVKVTIDTDELCEGFGFIYLKEFEFTCQEKNSWL